jgi:Holliday junction resolvasome RuvABC endonuclease subunit
MSDNEIGCLGIDPGSRFMGVSWVICNENFTKILHAEAVTVAAVSGLDKQLRKTHDDRFARLELIGDGLSKYLNGKDVRYASTEASFVNPRMKSLMGHVITLWLKVTHLQCSTKCQVCVNTITRGNL